MIKNQNILATLMIFLSQKETNETTSKTASAELFSKISNREKISTKQFHHCKANNFLENVTKSINSQTNTKSPGNDSISFINTYQMNYLISFNVYE